MPWRATLPQPVGVGRRGEAEAGLGGRSGRSVPKLRGAPSVPRLNPPGSLRGPLASRRGAPASRRGAPVSRRGPTVRGASLSHVARAAGAPRLSTRFGNDARLPPVWDPPVWDPRGARSTDPRPARSSDGRLGRSNDGRLGRSNDGRLPRSSDGRLPRSNDRGGASNDLGCTLRGPSRRLAAPALPSAATGRPQRGPSPVDRSEKFDRSLLGSFPSARSELPDVRTAAPKPRRPALEVPGGPGRAHAPPLAPSLAPDLPRLPLPALVPATELRRGRPSSPAELSPRKLLLVAPEAPRPALEMERAELGPAE
jgi:hypothetical protein